MEREQRAATLGADSMLALYERLRLRPGRAAGRHRGRDPATRPRRSTRRDRPRPARAGGPAARGRRAAGPVAAVAGARVRRRVPGRARAAGAAGDAGAGWASTSTASGTSSSTSTSRPGKQPRAFCAPVRVPDRVVLVVLPQGGHDDYRALFHEAGHVEHFAHASGRCRPSTGVLRRQRRHRGLGVPVRAPGVSDPAWLAARLDAPRAGRLRPLQRAGRAVHLRRYAAKLAYEIELHGGAALGPLPDRYAAPSGPRRRSSPTRRGDHLTDVDPRLLLHLLPAGVGVRGAALPSTCEERWGRTGSGAGRRASCCASCGSWASRWTPTSCCAS